MHDSPQLNVPVHNIACFLFNDYQMVINQSVLEAGYCASKALEGVCYPRTRCYTSQPHGLHTGGGQVVEDTAFSI